MAIMSAAASGVKVRMYRQGHGDCFLLAFRGEDGTPAYVLIDCGYKPGSAVGAEIDEIVEDIQKSTRRSIDIAVVTHEHQDHVNGFWKKNGPRFSKNIAFGESWWAWTEDETDEIANELRRRHADQLLSLMAVRNRLAERDEATLPRLTALLEAEWGASASGDLVSSFAAAGGDPLRSVNKQAMRFVRERTTGPIRYIRPHEGILSIPGVPGVRVFALGPPRDADLIADEDPRGAELFPGHRAATNAAGSFLAAALALGPQAGEPLLKPFADRFAIPAARAFEDGTHGEFFKRHYGAPDPKEADRTSRGETTEEEAADDASWRRIDDDWLYSAEALALKMNSGINNTSLVLAFELPNTRKVLLFAGDAQRGNWLSWADGDWEDPDRPGKRIAARDLLARTVLYKVGHHGSHNATLAGDSTTDHPSLGWMGEGSYGHEFTAMITAVPRWARTQQPPWHHPLPSLKAALVKKAGGRVFQTDEAEPTKPDHVSQRDWDAFAQRITCTDLYFEVEISDD